MNFYIILTLLIIGQLTHGLPLGLPRGLPNLNETGLFNSDSSGQNFPPQAMMMLLGFQMGQMFGKPTVVNSNINNNL